MIRLHEAAIVLGIPLLLAGIAGGMWRWRTRPGERTLLATAFGMTGGILLGIGIVLFALSVAMPDVARKYVTQQRQWAALLPSQDQRSDFERKLSSAESELASAIQGAQYTGIGMAGFGLLILLPLVTVVMIPTLIGANRVPSTTDPSVTAKTP